MKVSQGFAGGLSILSHFTFPLGSGARLKKVIHRALQGEDITISVVGGSGGLSISSSSKALNGQLTSMRLTIQSVSVIHSPIVLRYGSPSLSTGSSGSYRIMGRSSV